MKQTMLIPTIPHTPQEKELKEGKEIKGRGKRGKTAIKIHKIIIYLCLVKIRIKLIIRNKRLVA